MYLSCYMWTLYPLLGSEMALRIPISIHLENENRKTNHDWVNEDEAEE